ncbi:MAG TPA: class I SAM-dependent RNA methyltransferase [Burkholderiales bacterium]|nr:class I SAM-dependent RNA methyltransferase [Burkholderiales bacterium]
MEQYFATCPRGLEQVLADELAALGARDVSPVDGGVAFGGDLALCYAANLESRVASRVLWQVGCAGYRTEQEIFSAARALAWPRFFDVRRTIRVNVSAIKSPVRSLDFVTLSVKDAVCDAFRDARGSRPDVDTARPDVRIHVFLTRDQATFYLDTSGEALFKRGWRITTGDAPLKENLAAGILKLTGWKAPTPLFDPMCGSGTFLIEAAMMALDAAPGLNRAFGFEKLENFDGKGWRALQDKAGARRRPLTRLPVHGSDKSGTVLGLARENLAAAGIENAVQLKQMDILDGSPPAEPGIVVMNPPYGERQATEEELAAFYPRLGDALKQRYAGWTAYILTADLRLARLIGLKASKRTPLFNGALECRLFEYRMIAGTMRRSKPLVTGESEDAGADKNSN